MLVLIQTVNFISFHFISFAAKAFGLSAFVPQSNEAVRVTVKDKKCAGFSSGLRARLTQSCAMENKSGLDQIFHAWIFAAAEDMIPETYCA